MGKKVYSAGQIDAVLADFESVGNIALVSRKHGIPRHAIYRFRRMRELDPVGVKNQKIKQLSKDLKEKDLEVRILRELLKKTYQVMPIDGDWQKST